MLASLLFLAKTKIKYIGETARSQKKKGLYEHKRNIRFGNFLNALFLHLS